VQYLSFSIPGYTLNPPSYIPQGQGSAYRLIRLGVSLLLLAVVILCIFFIIWSGIQWITAGGDKNGVEQARARLTYSIVGLIVAFVAYFVVGIIGTIFHISFF